MDYIIEKDFWEALRPYLKDGSKVRVAVLYKYGQNTSGQMTDDGDIVWFELNSETDLDNLQNEGMNTLGRHTEAIATKLYDPNTIHRFIEFSSLFCPANEYIFAIWGHGNGFEPTIDIPGKICCRFLSFFVEFSKQNTTKEIKDSKNRIFMSNFAPEKVKKEQNGYNRVDSQARGGHLSVRR